MAELEFHADLRCELEGQPITITSSRSTAVVSVARWATLVSLAHLYSTVSGTVRPLLDRFLGISGCSVELRVRDQTVATIRASNGLSRILGIPPLHLHPIAIATSAFRKGSHQP